MKKSFQILLQDLLRSRFGLTDFREGQLEVLQSVLGRKDALAVMPTGRGKSLCFQMPALALPGRAVVISPLIALMKDQVFSLKNRGIEAVCLHTGQSLQEKREIFQRLKSQTQCLLYLSPERVQKPGFAQWIQSQQISLFAVDEAHCISQWGPEFRPDYHRLDLLRQLKPEVPILALTATATPQVLRDIERGLDLNKPDRHIYGFYRSNLYYQVEYAFKEEEKLSYVLQAIRQNPSGRILIYCGTRKQCEDLSRQLSGEFSGVGYYHAGMGTEMRAEIQERYHRYEVRILCATNAFGMGVDHPDVRLVVHYQMPATLENYYQEIGRAGRDGLSATCLLLYSKQDRGLHSYFIKNSEAPAQHLRYRWNALETMVQFSEGGGCRHSAVLTYFRDAQRIDACGHCDSCAPHDSLRIRLSRNLYSFKEGNGSFSDSSTAALSSPLEPELNSLQRVYAEQLKKWRKSLAQERDVPAFVIFSDRTLRHLIRAQPKSLVDLECIYGLGSRKIEDFGEVLLSELRSYESCASTA